MGFAAAQITSTATTAVSVNWTAMAWDNGVPGNQAGDVANANSSAGVTITFNQSVILKTLNHTQSAGVHVYFASSGGSTVTFDSGQSGTNATLFFTRSGADSLSMKMNAPIVLNSTLDAAWGRVQNREMGFGGVISGVGGLNVNYASVSLNGTGHIFRFGDVSTGSPNTYSGGTSLRAPSSTFTTAKFQAYKVNAFGTGALSLDTAAVDLQTSNQTIGGLSGGTGSSKISSLSPTSGTTTLTLDFSDTSGPFTFSGAIQAGGAARLVAVTKQGTGLQTLSGTNTYTGLTTLAGGTLALGSVGAMNGGGDVTFTGGTLRHADANGATIDLGARIRNSLAAIQIDTNGNSVSYAAIDATNVAGLQKRGGGTLTLTGTNAYTGGSTVAAGTLRIGAGSTAGSILGDVAFSAAGATLAFNRSDEVAFTGAITGGGQVRQVGLGRLTLSNAASSYSGGTFVDSGTLAVTAANALGTGNVTVASGARLQLDVAPALGGGSAISLLAGSQFVTAGNVAASLAAGSSLSGWSSTSAGGTAAGLLQATAVTATTFSTGWDTNPGDYLSDILTLDGTTASGSNVMVLSMAFDAGYSGLLTDLNIFTRPNASGTFAAVGTSFRGEVPWTSAFQTPGEYGVSGGRVWAVTDTNSQFVVDVTVVPEPAGVMLAACGATLTIWGLRRRRRCAG